MDSSSFITVYYRAPKGTWGLHGRKNYISMLVFSQNLCIPSRNFWVHSQKCLCYFKKLCVCSQKQLIHKTLYSPGKISLLAKVSCSPVKVTFVPVRKTKLLRTTEKRSHKLYLSTDELLRSLVKFLCFFVCILLNSAEKLLLLLTKTSAFHRGTFASTHKTLVCFHKTFAFHKETFALPCKSFAFT